jgi:8-oxo-dGTP pyrophosphatase MutT (NUDIX family)
MHTRQLLVDALIKYQTVFPEEDMFKAEFLKLLQHPRSFHRDHLPGHITGSAWIVDEKTEFTLLTHHAKLNKWLQPGGHADGDDDIVRVALREATEESGLSSFQLISPGIFDIDIHNIPQRKEFPEHLHYDVRILLQASTNEKLTVSEESHELAWIPLANLVTLTENNRSIIRMAEKLRRSL